MEVNGCQEKITTSEKMMICQDYDFFSVNIFLTTERNATIFPACRVIHSEAPWSLRVVVVRVTT